MYGKHPTRDKKDGTTQRQRQTDTNNVSYITNKKRTSISKGCENDMFRNKIIAHFWPNKMCINKCLNTSIEFQN